MSTCHAMVNAFGVRVEGPLRDLRRLIYCAEWIESHSLHICMLHAPDFLGYESAIHLAQDHPEVAQRGLQLKKTGNELLALIGGREIHPVNVRVGGFYRASRRPELQGMVDALERGRDAALETVRWVAGFNFPDFQQDYEFVALRHPQETPFNEGRLVSNKRLDMDIAQYDDHFVEEQVLHSNALHSRLRERGSYLAGPLGRYN
jgi:sulfhydrogenase subunit alpha